MSRKAISLATILFLVSIASAQFNSSSMRGPFDSGTVTVTALGPDGKPAAGVRVDLVAAQSRQSFASGQTNAAGIAEFNNVGRGFYEVIATKRLSQATERLQVDGSISSVILCLPGDGSGDVGDAATVSVAQFKVPGKARDEFKKAKKALDKREIEKAEKHIARALEIHPQYAEALTMRGILHLDAHQNELAATDFDAAIKADTGYSLAYFAMGATLNRLNKFDEALGTLDRGISLAPQSWQGYFEIAKAHVGKSDYKSALKSLDKAQSLLGQKYPPIHLVKAHALLALKQYGDAMGELQAFLEEAPQAPQSAAARQMLEEARAYAAKQ